MFDKITSFFTRKKPSATTQAKTGAGPAMAAHSKDAKAKGGSGQNKSAAAKKTH